MAPFGVPHYLLARISTTARERPASGMDDQTIQQKERGANEQSFCWFSACPLASRWRRFLPALILFILVLVIYFPAMRAGFIWDDDDYVLNNVTLRTVDGLRRIWSDPQATPQYYPMVHSSFWLEYHLWGLNPLGYHVVNILLHALAAVLLWRLLKRLEIPGAWLAAALFAVHPVGAETVAWITERKNLLSMVFALGAALVYFYACAPGEYRNRRNWAIGYTLALLFFFAGLLSKTVICTLPAVLLTLIWMRSGRLAIKDILLLVPWFILGGGMGMWTAWLEQHHVGARGAEWSLSLLDHVCLAGRIIWFYAEKVFLPHPLMFVYPRWNVQAANVEQWSGTLAFLLVLGILWQRQKRWGRGPLAAVLIFAGVLFPALGFFAVYPMRYSFVADHFQYHAMPALLVLFAAGVKRAGRGLPHRYWQRLGVGLMLLVLGLLTWQRCGAFANAESVWRDTLKKNPAAWIAHNNLGLILADRGEVRGAATQFQQALKVKPDHISAWTNLGRAQMALGQYSKAEKSLLRAQQLAPNDGIIRNNLGNLYAIQRQWNKALACYLQVLKQNPNQVDVIVNIGNLMAQQKKWKAATAAYRQALKREPRSIPAQVNFCQMLAETGKVSEAIHLAEQTLAQAKATKNSALAAQMKKRLAVYRRLQQGATENTGE